MSLNGKILPLAAIVVSGIVLGLAIERNFSPADAGGICQTSGFSYVTSSPDGATVYRWHLEARSPSVIRYDFGAGTVVQRDLKVAAFTPDEKVEAPAEGQTPEIHVTGVVWTPDPATRFAIINGRTVREGDVFETRSGKKYRVNEIRKNDDVDYQEVVD